mmetsp:Transcript_41527/g.82148  ORF Transcript_41527/g.82148 Transcript_41527/m.82148 type:complete len:83 (+) Transcript_41527:446-694(+)|eukprot:CAMPEP_0172668024 /NCGR_PEP_ID=MMETSP1074-20121228/8807_1 /TAXON_ID=2916 /ORGANISM="Ceratium fusus, Strain PA161109" /LENGTH=82 /DNA_ID=CAMNT_0013484621 /DNA_START=446 /DNA_END=694 /DNA_ORIENTATION=+
MVLAVLESSTISDNSAISACSIGAEWERTLTLFVAMGRAILLPDTISYNSFQSLVGITGCTTGLSKAVICGGLHARVPLALV